MNGLTIDGQAFGSTNSGTVQVARDRRTVHVSIDVDDDDAFLCFGDDDLREYELDIDLYAGASNTCIDGGRFCYTANAIASPDVCFKWNAQYLDAGPWTGIGSEDFLQSKGIQNVPASFARYQLQLVNSTGVLFDRGGALDANGCVPGPKLPIREHWQLGGNLQVTGRLISQLCLDPAGTDCPMSGAIFTGVNITVLRNGAGGAEALCETFAENPGAVNAPTCDVRQLFWASLPPSPVQFIHADEDGVTRTSAAMSFMLQREAETNGGLGIVTAMATRRLEGDGHVQVVVDKFCDTTDPCSNQVLHTTCRREGQLLLEPEGLIASTTRFKNVLAHEFGHFIQGNAQGLMALNYGCGAGDPNMPPLCRCDHVLPDERLHCLQSLEEPNAAQIEGFGYFYAAKAFNADVQPDCTLIYGKAVANTACMPGARSCAQDSATGLFVSQPPVPVSCRQAIRWRNSQCADASSSPDVLASGVEWDWVDFLYGVNNLASSTERWSVVDLFNAYAAACAVGSTTSFASCEDKKVSWAGGNGHFTLAGGAQALATAGLKSQAAVDQFVQSGNDFGVSNLP